MNWIQKHSVNCFKCGKLADERDCIVGINGEGSICPPCQNIIELNSEEREIIFTALCRLLDENRDQKDFNEIDALRDKFKS